MFLDSAFETLVGFSYVSRTAVFSGADPLVHHILGAAVLGFSLGCISKVFSVLHLLKIIWTLMFWKILLNSSHNHCMYGTETKASLEVSSLGVWSACVLW